MTADLHFVGFGTSASRSGAEIDERAARLAGGLAAMGITDGDVIAVLLRFLHEDGSECATGEPGLVYARQPAFPDFEYQNQPEARRKIERDGRVTLGDVGYLDADGYLFLCDRASDMVISGGVNIYPAEIEHVLVAKRRLRDAWWAGRARRI